MEIIYKAWDGTEFKEKNACEKYEYTNPYIVMYDNNGRVLDSDNALIIVLKYDDDAEKFIELCEKQGTSSDGITEDCHGLYVWDDIEERYSYVSDRVKDALKRYFED